MAVQIREVVYWKNPEFSSGLNFGFSHIGKKLVSRPRKSLCGRRHAKLRPSAFVKREHPGQPMHLNRLVRPFTFRR